MEKRREMRVRESRGALPISMLILIANRANYSIAVAIFATIPGIYLCRLYRRFLIDRRAIDPYAILCRGNGGIGK